MRDRTFFRPRHAAQSERHLRSEGSGLNSIGEFAIDTATSAPAHYFVWTSTCPQSLIALITILVLRTEKGWTGQ